MTGSIYYAVTVFGLLLAVQTVALRRLHRSSEAVVILCSPSFRAVWRLLLHLERAVTSSSQLSRSIPRSFMSRLHVFRIVTLITMQQIQDPDLWEIIS